MQTDQISPQSRLTDEQIQARRRMREQIRQLRAANDVKTEEPPSGSSHGGGGAQGVEITFSGQGEQDISGTQNSSDAQDTCLNEFPAGPPWRYDLTEEEQLRRAEKKAQRAQKKQRIKKVAFEKTPEKLKNPTDIQVRFRTGLAYTLITVGCVLAGDIPLLLLLMVTAGICAGEFYYMLRRDAKLPNETLGIIAAVLYPLSMYLFGARGVLGVTIALMLALMVWYVFWLRSRIPDVGVSFFGAVYTGLLLCGLVVIERALPFPWGGIVLLLLFLSVWANDAFAYLVGSKWGRHKLAPRTSPKKSWEGFAAGLLGSVIFWCVISFVPGVTMPIPMAVVFGLVCAAMEVMGDLAESRIKRNSGVKDSGTIMPGHGGLLDRCDSLFLMSVTAALLMMLGGCLPIVL